MNIAEAYAKFNGQLIILISGISGSGSSELANNVSRDFKMKLVSYKKFTKPDKEIAQVSLTFDENTVKFINWDSNDVINWKEFIKEIDSHKKTGVVAISQSFPKRMYESVFNPDFHINIKLSKQNLLKKRIEYIKRKAIKFDNNNDTQNDVIITSIFNKYTFPYYLQSSSVDTTKITKYINANEYGEGEQYSHKLYDETFNYLVHMISTWLNNHNANKSNNNTYTHANKTKSYSKSNNIDGEFYKMQSDEDNLDDSDEADNLDEVD